MRKDEIKIRIEKLKEEKENLKFGYDKFVNYFTLLLIFLASVAITTPQLFHYFSYQLLAIIIPILLIFIYPSIPCGLATGINHVCAVRNCPLAL